MNGVSALQDTDSIILASSSANFADLVKDEYREHYAEIAAFLFGFPESDAEQAGFLKVALSYLYGYHMCISLSLSAGRGCLYSGPIS